jgi:hypothetical protein
MKTWFHDHGVYFPMPYVPRARISSIPNDWLYNQAEFRNFRDPIEQHRLFLRLQAATWEALRGMPEDLYTIVLLPAITGDWVGEHPRLRPTGLEQYRWYPAMEAWKTWATDELRPDIAPYREDWPTYGIRIGPPQPYILIQEHYPGGEIAHDKKYPWITHALNVLGIAG